MTSSHDEARLAYENACRAWPNVRLDRTSFERYVQERAPSSDHSSDLFLACACLENVPNALEAFEQRYLANLGRVIHRIDPSPAFLEDVRQLLRERLFLSAKLAGYSGHGALESWVAIAAQRIALNLKRRDRPHEPLAEELVGRLAVDDAPELAYARHRYRKDFETELIAALGSLSERDRMILRLSLVGGLSHAQIAAIYRVAQPTITRWINQTFHRISTMVRDGLSVRLGLSVNEAESLIRSLKSVVEISLSRILAGSAAGEPGDSEDA